MYACCKSLPQALDIFPLVERTATHSPPDFRNPLVNLAITNRKTKLPLFLELHMRQPSKPRYPTHDQDDHGLEQLNTDIDAFRDAFDYRSCCLHNPSTYLDPHNDPAIHKLKLQIYLIYPTVSIFDIKDPWSH